MAERPIQLYTHPASPFCRRVTYALGFKGVAYETIETDLQHPTAEFQAVSHTGKIPALCVWRQNQPFGIVESLAIMEYVDSYPGPPLYARSLDGRVDYLKKALLDAAILKHVELLLVIFSNTQKYPTAESQVQAFQHSLTELDQKYLTDGRNFGHSVLDCEMLSAGDLALLPVIELIDACRETRFPGLHLEHYRGLWTWYERIREQPWVSRNFPGLQHIAKAVSSVFAGHKLTLPVTLYD